METTASSNSIREELEKKASAVVCTCYYFDFVNEKENMSDEELHKIISIPFYLHLENQLLNPVSYEEFVDTIEGCTDWQAVKVK